MDSNQRDPQAVTLGMLVTGRGLASLPKGRRLLLDMLTPGLVLVLSMATRFAFDLDGFAWGAVGFSVAWLAVALVRYWMPRGRCRYLPAAPWRR